MRIAFYAPLKEPGHPVPSGDRQMARLIVAALSAGGHEVEVVSRLRAYLARPDGAARRSIQSSADAEAERIANCWTSRAGLKPDLWFTYHAYYKAPDFLGPRLARQFGLPYATAEASHADKRRHGPWAPWHRANAAAIKAAAVHFCFTKADRDGLEQLLGSRQRLIGLPPFIDAAPFAGTRAHQSGEQTVQLVTVAMMRPGAKARSYAFLAQALARLQRGPAWHLSVIGSGPAWDEVRAMFAELPAGRISWRGQLGQAEIAAALGAADVFVWPGFDEAYGMSYLEAGAAGVPALAMRCGGIGSVVRDGETGLLAAEGDLAGFAAALAALIADAPLRRRLGRAARRFVLEERSVTCAAAILQAGLGRTFDLAPLRVAAPA